ncbi:ABC transporter permease [Bradyrhizobium hipponense]|uniref:ABC transporter permease n=1 Tax=Bradyrhizobium hipponense TaxID=2605638 RepID=A0A5S4YA67_9BRAD|nr:ABC transporter permease [Bradyrhizobium hipponense]TYO60882.1 ABC transporter permease [Bradyrhizobium hipponense]
MTQVPKCTHSQKARGIIIDRLARRYAGLRNAMAFVVYAFTLLPTLIVIPISFGGAGEMSFPPSNWTLELYEQLFSSSAWVSSILQSTKVSCLATLLAILIAVPAAYGLGRFDFPGKRLVLFLVMSPMVVPVVVTSLGLYLYFSRLHLVGTTIGLVLSHVAYVTPFVVITVMAGVNKLDPALELAASIMGAKRLAVLLKVVLPQLRPSIIAGALFAFLMSFDEVVIAWFITSPETTTLPVKMYTSVQWEISPIIAAVSALLTMLSIVFCCLSIFLLPGTAEPSR